MADNYCFPAFGSTLKIDESLNSINAHLPHQLTTYTDQFLLSLPYPYPYPPHPTRLSSSSSLRLSSQVTWSLSSNQSICPSFPLERKGRAISREIGLIKLSNILEN